MKKISIILPTRNEEQLIKSTINSITSFLKTKKYDYEILVVLNGSSDKTEKIVNELSKENKSLKILKSKPGYGYALRKGLKNAKGEYVAIYNVDFFDLDMIRLIDIDLYGKDLIIGSKMTPWSEDNRPFIRKLISSFLNTILKIQFGFKGSDTHGIKIMRKKLSDKILPICQTSSGIFDTEFVIKAQYKGFKISDYPVNIIEKRSSRFPNRLLETPKDLFELWRAMKNN